MVEGKLEFAEAEIGGHGLVPLHQGLHLVLLGCCEAHQRSQGHHPAPPGDGMVVASKWKPAMGLSHCPICIGLALLCTVRCGAHALLLLQLS